MDTETTQIFDYVKDETRELVQGGLSFMDILETIIMPRPSYMQPTLFRFVEYAYMETLYLEAGRHDYEVAPALAEKLLHTELRGVKQADVIFPFECIKLFIPSEFRLAALGLIGNPEWILVGRADSFVEEPSLGLSGYVCSMRAVCLSKGGTPQAISIPLFGGKNTSDIKSQEEIAVPDDIKDIVDGFGERSHNSDIKQFFSWLVNLVMYITSKETRKDNIATNKEWIALGDGRIDRLPAGRKKERLTRHRRSLDPGYRIHIGVDVAPLGSAREGSSPTVRTLVQGHWRNQVCGPQWQERKLIWIQPFWRGPEFAEATNPIRVLQ